jgi:hypothetical protein
MLPATAPRITGTMYSITTTPVNADTDPDFSKSACPSVMV